jgi:GTP pyrophosphokinase
MIDVEDLIALVRNYNPRSNADLIREAYEYGMRMHEGQFRHSGEPYFTHPIAVAAILTEMRLDDATIVTALLHDTVEDTRSTKEEIVTIFGPEIADLVDGVTKLTNLQLSNTQSRQAENFRKLFMAMSRDLRVILVKLADRLHNMRTIRSMRPDKQVQKARETMDIYAPLAERINELLDSVILPLRLQSNDSARIDQITEIHGNAPVCRWLLPVSAVCCSGEDKRNPWQINGRNL